MRKALGIAILLALPQFVFSQSSAQIEANKGVLKVSPTAALPSPCRQGQLWFDSTTTTPKSCNDGTNWVAIGGSIAPGTATTCTANSILYTDAAQALQCNPATVVNGSVSTAGRSILTIADTISGSSATSNFLNITGAFPATLSAETNGVNIAIVVDNDGQVQNALKVATSGSGGNIDSAVRGSTSHTGTYSIGVLGESLGITTNSVGVLGYSGAGTNRVGGYFTLSSSTPGPSASVGLLADNGAVAANIFEARDNGTAVITIRDGGILNLSYGSSVASATALPAPSGNTFHVTGTTTITSITTTGMIAGTTVTLIFDGILTFTDGSNLKLNGNFVTSADDTITLVYDGTNFYEIARSVN